MPEVGACPGSPDQPLGPFVWLPGWSVGPGVWDAEIALWPDAVHGTVDFSGCASADAFVAAARAALEDVDGPARLVGWSLGAMVALELALREPERAAGLYLVGAAAAFASRDGDGSPVEGLRRMQARIPTERERVLASFERRMFAPAESGLFAAWRKRAGDGAWSETALLAGLDYLAGFALPDADPLSVPAFLLHGSEDGICPPAAAERLARLIPGGHLTLWEGAGHLPFWTDGGRFHAWLRGKLAA